MPPALQIMQRLHQLHPLLRQHPAPHPLPVNLHLPNRLLRPNSPNPILQQLHLPTLPPQLPTLPEQPRLLQLRPDYVQDEGYQYGVL